MALSFGHGPLASASATMPNVSVGHLLLQMVFAVAVVGGGIYVFGKFVQRRRRGGMFTSKAALRGLSVRSRTSLGKDHLLAVVEWGDRELLIGVSNQTVALIAEGEVAEIGADLPEPRSAPAATASPFKALRPVARNGERPSFVEALRAATLRG